MRSLKTIIILSFMHIPFCFGITSRISFGVISKTCQVELRFRQQVQQTFIQEDCKTAIDLCEEWATIHQAEGKCLVNQNPPTDFHASNCSGICPGASLPKDCPSIETCGKKPRIGEDMERYMEHRKCVRAIEVCENKAP